jgi:hypothetical protein
MSIVFVGIDLAKNVFAVHGVSAAGAPCKCANPRLRAASCMSWWPRRRRARSASRPAQARRRAHGLGGAHQGRDVQAAGLRCAMNKNTTVWLAHCLSQPP